MLALAKALSKSIQTHSTVSTLFMYFMSVVWCPGFLIRCDLDELVTSWLYRRVPASSDDVQGALQSSGPRHDGEHSRNMKCEILRILEYVFIISANYIVSLVRSEIL